MRIFRFLVQAFFVLPLLLAAEARAEERYVTFAENRGWTVSYDRQQNNCIAVPKAADGLYFIRPSSREIVVMIAGPKFAWVTDEKDYKVEIRTDRQRWDGTMRADTDEGFGGLYVSDPSESFMSALRGASRLSLRVENVNYGPYSLSGSSDTLKQILGCAQAVERGEFKPAEPDYIGMNGLVSWKSEDFGKSYTAEGWTLALKGQDNVDGTATAYLEVSREGKGSTTIKAESVPEGRGFGKLGIYKFDWSDPAVLFTSYTGGAHCCIEARVALSTDDGIRIVDLGQFDGDVVHPVDLDGDGVYEFEFSDQRFLYAFAPYAGSVPPVQVEALRDGKFIDVTKEAAYRPVVEQALLRTMKLCGEEQYPGACAGALANAALLGLYSSAFEFMVFDEINAKLEDSYLKCSDAAACRGRGDFKDFQEAVAFRLKDWGYDTKPAISEPAAAFFGELAKTKTGYSAPGDTTEGGCAMGPTRFEEARAKGIVAVSGYEYSCHIGRADVLRDSVVTEALCTGEGEYWLDRQVFEKDGSDLWQHSMSRMEMGLKPVKAAPCPAKP